MKKKDAIGNIFISIFSLLIFPISGLILTILLVIEDIQELHEINKEIKEEKIEKIIEKIIERKEKNNDYKKEEI